MEALGEEVNEDELFYDVVGGHDRKRRLYGFGSFGNVIPSDKRSKEACYIPDVDSDKEIAQAKAEMTAMKEVVNNQKEEINELKELMKTQAEEHNAKLAQAMALFSSFKETQNK